MNDLKKAELDKLKQKIKDKYIKQQELLKQDIINKSLYYLGRMGLSILFNNSEDLPSIIEESNKNAEEQRKYIENKEKGYHYWYNEKSEPFSKEFGCPHCGGYCFTPYKSSHCELEGCESEGNLLVYCPKISCAFGLVCESQTIPLGCWFPQKDYNKGDYLDIHYKSKIYTFKIQKCLLNGSIIKIIRKFFDYETRNEISEWLTLENISNENQ